MHHREQQLPVKGYSLAEVLVALGITVGIGMIVFQLFQQNERIFRDQHVVIEMHQAARVVAAQIADEVRLAGQGVPVYASSFDNGLSESVAVILASSTNTRIDFRSGISLVETNVMAASLDCPLGVSQTLAVGDGSLFLSAAGTASPGGRFVYIWGPAGDSTWTWVRAELSHISGNMLTVIPRQLGSSGHFAGPPAISLEEAVSFSLSGTTIRRATVSDMTNQTSPAWAAANEIGRNFSLLNFVYYDKDNNLVTPSSLASRVSIARVDVKVVAQAPGPLSNGSLPSYSLSLRTTPRNLRLR